MKMLLRDLVSSATRLGVIGPLQGSFLHAETVPFIETLLSHFDSTEEAIVHPPILVMNEPLRFFRGRRPRQSSPVVDFLQSRQDTLYTRLFNS
jgi:urease accessory protein UreF